MGGKGRTKITTSSSQSGNSLTTYHSKWKVLARAPIFKRRKVEFNRTSTEERKAVERAGEKFEKTMNTVWAGEELWNREFPGKTSYDIS